VAVALGVAVGVLVALGVTVALGVALGVAVGVALGASGVGVASGSKRSRPVDGCHWTVQLPSVIQPPSSRTGAGVALPAGVLLRSCARAGRDASARTDSTRTTSVTARTLFRRVTDSYLLRWHDPPARLQRRPRFGVLQDGVE